MKGSSLIDGGVWANNPVAIATVEAIGVLGWQAAGLRVLRLGCTTAPLDLDWGREHSLGKLSWATKIADLFMAAQSASATGMAQHLLPDRNNLVRISPVVGKNRLELDQVCEIPSLRGLGDSEARKASRNCAQYSSMNQCWRISLHTTALIQPHELVWDESFATRTA